MSVLFYDHLVDWSDFEKLARDAGARDHEWEKLARAIDEILHHEVMDVALTVLPLHVHGHFVEGVKAHPHAPRHLQLLLQYDPGAEDQVRERITVVRQRFVDSLSAPVVR